ncbi:MAG: hypothetical protein CM1200mP18_02370 [Gammaproteobacteria bacterium]|nr:MAG: hypothetical protein CM1200mP18_02370 [Gammaproteobacteria bacterium]
MVRLPTDLIYATSNASISKNTLILIVLVSVNEGKTSIGRERMIITRAETILVSIPFKAGGIPPWSFGGDPKCNFDTLLIRLETDSGLVGWGEAFSRNEDQALKAMIDTRVLPLVVGRDAASIASLKFDLEFQLHNFGRIGPIMYGISGVDIALWDLLGKATNRPLVDLLGGSFAEEFKPGVCKSAPVWQCGGCHTNHPRGYRAGIPSYQVA